MSRRSKRKGLSPAIALAMLVTCGGVAGWSMLHTFGGRAQVSDAGAPVDPGLESEDDVGAAADEGPLGVDLLAVHGSWARTGSVRMAFASLVDVGVAPAPIAETGGPTGVRWVGPDPPVLHLGVVMIGDVVRRAVIDGAVVGIGDVIGRTTVVAIERDAVVVAWGTRRLTYDLEGDQPREFRAELQRRGGEKPASETEPRSRQEGQ